jgi:hypothetical protein
VKISTYVVGEDFEAEEALGLPLPVRCADMFGVAEADTRPTGGELVAVEGAIST